MSNTLNINELDAKLVLLKKEIIPFTERLFTKFNSEINVISPIGFFSALAIVYNMAEPTSRSSKEIHDMLILEQPSLQPEILCLWNERFHQLDITSANAFLRPSMLKAPSEALQTVLDKSKTVLVSDRSELIKFVKEKSQGRIQHIEIHEDPRTQVLLNIVALQFQWKSTAILRSEIEKFYRKNGKTMDTHYVVHNVTTNYIKNDRYEACVLRLKKNHGEEERSTESKVAAFIILPHQDIQLSSHWSEVHEALKKQSLQAISVHIPPFELEEELEFTAQKFPSLLREENSDFPMVSDDVTKLKIKQKSKIYADEIGLQAVSATTVQFLPRSCLLPDIVFSVTRSFMFVVAEFDSGVPIFISNVDEVLNPKSK